MGEIQNSRHERFAQELAAGNPADAAYEAAGYRKHRGNAARLSANEHVKERVARNSGNRRRAGCGHSTEPHRGSGTGADQGHGIARMALPPQ